MFKTMFALAMAFSVALAATAGWADGAAPQPQLCGKDSLWQQALGLDQVTPQAGMANAPSCTDPTQIQEAAGCCNGHGGPAGCDAETHKVICADGKKSKSCEC